jgi:HSP20 family protein
LAPFQRPLFGQGDPFAQMQADMQAMQERMNNFFGHAAMGIGQDLGGGFGLQELGVEERDGAYVFHFQAQGLDQGSLKVRVDDGQLSVSGEYAQDLGNMKTSSSFSRMSSLPGPVDAASLKTDYKDGVLTITVNKQPSRIQRDHTAQRGGGLPH